jgi:hypothetical protein
VKNVIARVMTDSNRDKRFMSALVRLRKNGRFSRINGKVYDIKLSQDGEPYAIVDNLVGTTRKHSTRKWQSVPLNQIIQIKKDGFLYRK